MRKRTGADETLQRRIQLGLAGIRFVNYFDELVRHAVRSSGEARARYCGFSSAEIEGLQKTCGRPLPPAYRTFLLVMGRRTGLAFEHVTMSFDGPTALLAFQSHARDLISECEVAYCIPDAAFFCSNYLDSQLSYFDWDLEEEDPRLFDFEVGNPEQPSSKYTIGSYTRLILTKEK